MINKNLLFVAIVGIFCGCQERKIHFISYYRNYHFTNGQSTGYLYHSGDSEMDSSLFEVFVDDPASFKKITHDSIYEDVYIPRLPFLEASDQSIIDNIHHSLEVYILTGKRLFSWSDYFDFEEAELPFHTKHRFHGFCSEDLSTPITLDLVFRDSLVQFDSSHFIRGRNALDVGDEYFLLGSLILTSIDGQRHEKLLLLTSIP